jgi:hypothetical protein
MLNGQFRCVVETLPNPLNHCVLVQLDLRFVKLFWIVSHEFITARDSAEIEIREPPNLIQFRQ